MILVTGGLGYIGSHCVLALLKKGLDVVIFDNLSTGHIETYAILKQYGNLKFQKGDLKNIDDIDKLFKNNKIDSVVHFAAYSQVNESIKNPDKYYQNNVIGSINLFSTMIKYDVKKIVFSSTAATYGEPKYIPIDENHPQEPINPYGKTKLMIENILDDFDYAYGLKSVRLRYFNVAGANEDAIIGEWHNVETHLIPNILKSTFDTQKTFEIFGNDYKTQDGTCIRDYINIDDLIEAHILALNYLDNGGKTDYFNLGTNNGSSVLEVFETCKKVVKKEINVKTMPKREGDPVKLIAENLKAKNILNWQNKKNLEDSINSAYLWEKKLQEILKIKKHYTLEKM